MRNVFTGWAIFILLISTNSRAGNSSSPDGPHAPPEYTYADHKGYQYSYKTTVGGEDESWIGTVEVKAPKTNELVFKQTNLRPGGCSIKEFAKPRALRHGPEHREIVALCGEDEGHFATLLLFESGNLLASLNYVITEPNLVWSGIRNINPIWRKLCFGTKEWLCRKEWIICPWYMSGPWIPKMLSMDFTRSSIHIHTNSILMFINGINVTMLEIQSICP